MTDNLDPEKRKVIISLTAANIAAAFNTIPHMAELRKATDWMELIAERNIENFEPFAGKWTFPIHLNTDAAQKADIAQYLTDTTIPMVNSLKGQDREEQVALTQVYVHLQEAVFELKCFVTAQRIRNNEQ